MPQILKSEKIPYFLVLLFAIIAVQFNYIFNNISKVPIVEYSFNDLTKSDTGKLYQGTLTIKNISNDKLIRDLHIQLKYHYNNKYEITCPDIIPVPPASVNEPEEPNSSQNKLDHYFIKIIQPGLSYQLIFHINNNIVLPTLFFECGEPLKFERKSFFTYLFSHQVLINFIFMICFLFLSCIYMIKISK